MGEAVVLNRILIEVDAWQSRRVERCAVRVSGDTPRVAGGADDAEVGEGSQRGTHRVSCRRRTEDPRAALAPGAVVEVHVGHDRSEFVPGLLASSEVLAHV